MDDRLIAVLKQASQADGIPVVFITRQGKPLWLVMPQVKGTDGWHPMSDQARWLNVHGTKHNYVSKPVLPHWEVPRAWLNLLVRRLLERYNACYIVQGLRVKEVCAPACWNAKGFVCECSCMGANHSRGHSEGWYTVSESCAVRWRAHELHYKLLRQVAR